MSPEGSPPFEDIPLLEDDQATGTPGGPTYADVAMRPPPPEMQTPHPNLETPQVDEEGFTLVKERNQERKGKPKKKRPQRSFARNLCATISPMVLQQQLSSSSSSEGVTSSPSSQRTQREPRRSGNNSISGPNAGRQLPPNTPQTAVMNRRVPIDATTPSTLGSLPVQRPGTVPERRTPVLTRSRSASRGCTGSAASNARTPARPTRTPRNKPDPSSDFCKGKMDWLVASRGPTTQELPA